MSHLHSICQANRGIVRQGVLRACWLSSPVFVARIKTKGEAISLYEGEIASRRLAMTHDA